MSSRIFTVKFIAAKNNFCYLSSKNADFAEQGVVLKVTSVDSLDYYLTTILTTLKANVIGVNSLQAKLLNLNEGDDVMVTVCRDVSTLKKFTISPLTNDDYEILELLAENVETTLLNQIRVVNVNQKLIIWINDSLHLVANVDSTHPVNPGLIDNFTEVSIEFPKKRGEIVANTEKWSFKNFLHYFTKKDPQSDVRSNLNSYLNLHSSLVFRLHPVEDVVGECNEELIQHFNVFVREKDLPKYFIKINTSCNIHKMKVIIRPASTSYTGDSFSTVGEITIRLIILENSSNNLNFPTMYVHQCIFKNFNIKIGSKAFLSGCSKLHSPVTGVEILTSNGCKDGLEQFKSFLGGSQNLLLNSGVVLKIKSDFICSLKFTPSTSKFWFVTSDSVRNCKFKLSDVEVTQIEENVEKLTQDYFENFGNVREIIQDTLSVVSSIKMLENVLIVGKAGSGKSALTKVFSQKLARPPSYIYAEEISCKNLKGKSLDSLHKLLVNKFENLIFYQPSALIMDDLHVICEATNSEDELTPETLHFNRVSEMLSIMLEKLCKNHQIAVVATCESTFKLNRYIFASRGQQLFKNVFNLQLLTKEDRNRLIHHLFNQRLKLDPISVNVEQLSIKTEGFVVRDLVDFVDRAIFESIKEESEALDMPHCETALESISSLSLKDVNLHSPGERDFSDVGGMDDAKKTLIESMMWPVQYPNLFDNAPLRLQSGMLLYGPPGTGKTILAGAAAKQCGLRLISIKGPELLSKYIGASELAVRNVFEKAQSAKPCILFFDEFDSLAPRRGHDSTGVTDRVVNQLLTQLDGVESLSGVCVLAATSRPDLLDPALLRPGRLDKQIFCDLPNKETRLKILLVLSKNLSLSSDVDLLDVSEKTTRFSGADLQSLLYTAQLSALDNLSDELGSTTFTGIQINRNHVDEALKNTRPSLTKDEELKYKKIYSKFHQKSSTEDMKLGLQKATLA